MKSVKKQIALNVLFFAVFVTFATTSLNHSIPASGFAGAGGKTVVEAVAERRPFMQENADELAVRDDIFAGEVWDNIYSNILVSVNNASIEPLHKI